MCTKDHGQRVSGRDLAASAWSGCAQVREPPEATQVRPQTLTASRVRVPAVRDGVIPCVPTGVAFQISRLQLARGGRGRVQHGFLQGGCGGCEVGGTGVHLLTLTVLGV